MRATTIRALSLQDVFAQLAGATNNTTPYDPNTVINSLAADSETANIAAASETWTSSHTTDYPLNLIQDAGPSAYWRLDDPASSTTVYDSSPFNNTMIPRVPLTVSGGVTFQTAGAMPGSKGATFNGSTGYLTASTATPLSFVTNLTLEAWVKTSSLAAAQTIVDKGGTAGEFGLTINTDGSVALSFDAGSGGGSNLIDANASDIETSAAGWSAGSNTTIVQSTAQAHTGTHALKMTGTATGAMFAFTNARYSVTAGTSYTASAWFYCASPGRSVYLDIDWYNSSGTYISSATSTTYTLTPGVWTQVSFNATAVAGAASVVYSLSPTANTAGDVFYADTITLTALGGSSNLTLIPAGGITTGAWHHVAVTRTGTGTSGGTATGYLDGVQKNTATWSGSVVVSANAVRVGATAGTAGKFFNGVLDEIVIYQRALSATQIAKRVTWAQAADCTSSAYGTGTYGFTAYPLPGAPTDYTYGSAATWGGNNAFFWG
ncbi:LamG-like jellyroll fold domain-containing protein [Streptomyces sp. NPDC001404]|uniref:LamG-like jellyroll fold domain-containing protein n=1 Tax=Streptomyces sp. NPDC001404 TaxID=3364571 RepID=UPI0036770816